MLSLAAYSADACQARQWLYEQARCLRRVGMLFLPKDEKLADLAKQIVEDVVKKEGHCHIVGWRDVPVVHEAVGRMARDAEPRIVQVWHRHALGSHNGIVMRFLVLSCRKPHHGCVLVRTASVAPVRLSCLSSSAL